MRKYSQADLLTEELESFNHPNIFKQILYQTTKTSTIRLSIELPLNLYLRGEHFCNDVEDLSGFQFTQNDLMNLLYNDFLLHVKKNPDPKSIHDLLSSLEHNYKREMHLVPEGKTIFKVLKKDRKQDNKELVLRMRKKVALRGEILLADMEEIYPDHGFTLEKIFEILYIDFIDQYRKGKNAAVMERVLQLLEEE